MFYLTHPIRLIHDLRLRLRWGIWPARRMER